MVVAVRVCTQVFIDRETISEYVYRDLQFVKRSLIEVMLKENGVDQQLR
jgi:hypothetical protein